MGKQREKHTRETNWLIINIIISVLILILTAALVIISVTLKEVPPNLSSSIGPGVMMLIGFFVISNSLRNR